MENKSYLNADLIGSNEQFDKSITNDFIGNDFEEQLEWSMLMIQSKFKQTRLSNDANITANTFDKAYLMSASLNDDLKYLKPFGELQATPEMFPNLNIKFMIVSDTISLQKHKELTIIEKRNLSIKNKYAYEKSIAFYNKDTESFYTSKEGYEVNPTFFNGISNPNDLPKPISLHPNYSINKNILELGVDSAADIINGISMSYQVAFSLYYEWSIYIKEYDNIGLVIPINPEILSEIYKTSLLEFENKKRMIHFVKNHYRRKKADVNQDYSIFIQRYLRGENKFNYKGFKAEIIPPKYDLNRVKTRKTFINTLE
jgi:hypothetical protein